MSNRLVSVIVPTFNREAMLRRAIDSALAQTHRELEVVVVDDGSTDGTARMLETVYASDQRVRHLRQSNAGAAAARNTGLAAARGAYLAFLDSDDLWLPWKIELQLACLDRFTAAGMVSSDMDAVDRDGRLISARYLRKAYGAYQLYSTDQLFTVHERWRGAELSPSLDDRPVDVYCGDIYAAMIMGNLVHTSTVLLTRERFEQVRAFREDLRYSGEDYDFHLRTCRAGPVAFVDLATIAYTVGMADQLTRPEMMIHIAKNSLKTIEAVIQEDRSTRRLPKRLTSKALADTNRWIGEELVQSGSSGEARGYFLRSLRFKPWAPRVIMLTIASLLPMKLIKTMAVLLKYTGMEGL